jgi:hypothetical protein
VIAFARWWDWRQRKLGFSNIGLFLKTWKIVDNSIQNLFIKTLDEIFYEVWLQCEANDEFCIWQ